MNIFNKKFENKFFTKHLGINYMFEPNFVEDFEKIMNLDILDSMLSKTNIWNNQNFIMMLDQKQLNFKDYSSISLDISGNNHRPDVNKVQNLVSRGASIILNDIQRHNISLMKFTNELQRLTNGRCQANLYFSMASHQAFGPHFDLHDVFAVHFEGEKVWNIYENIEKNPINHPSFKLSDEQRRKRAGKIIDQVTLRPGDLLYIPRGQYHDALASKNGAVHIAFGLSYFKSIDIMTTLWQKFVLNDYMRSDIKINADEKEIKSSLKKLSGELEKILNSEEATEIIMNSFKNWSYDMKEYSIKSIVESGPDYNIDKSIKIELKDKKNYLTSLKGSVEIPNKFDLLIQYIMKQETINEKNLKIQFEHISDDIITECIENLKQMNVIK